MGNSGEFARCLRVAMLKDVAMVVARQEKSVYREEGTGGVRRSWRRGLSSSTRVCYCGQVWAGHANLVSVVAGECLKVEYLCDATEL